MSVRWTLALFAFAHAATGPAAELALPALMQGLSEVPASHARFTETRQMAVLQAPLVLSGRLDYVRPDRLEKHVLAPYDERTRIHGSTVTVENLGRKTKRTLSLASAPAVYALVEGMRATLAGDLRALERHYSVSLAGQSDDWTLTLSPRAPEVAALITSLRIGGSGSQITRIEVIEAGGDRSTMAITPERP